MENIDGAQTSSQESFDVDLNGLDEFLVEGEANGSQASSVHTQDDDLASIEIDERFKSLPTAEGTLRTLQSQRDSAKGELVKLQAQIAEQEKISEFFNQLLEDENLLVSFVNEVKPDLIKSRDRGTQLKEVLKKEFGEDFKPQLSREEAERDDPFGTDARYYAKVDLLRKKLLEEDGGQPTTVKEYLARKKQAEEAEAQKYAQERDAVKAELKMSDEEMQAVSDWAMKLKFKDIVKINRLLRKTNRLPNLNNVSGGQVQKSEAQRFLDSLIV